MSSFVLFANGVLIPGYSFTGRRLMYWSRSKRSLRRRPFSMIPGGTSGRPTAPR